MECWGSNAFGALGNPQVDDTCLRAGGVVCSKVPVPVQGLSDVRDLSVGYSHACALLSTGEAYCWGNNASGEVGVERHPAQRCLTTYCEPLPVPVATSLRFIDLAAGSSYTCGVASTGRVYCWGFNGAGQLGRSASSPPIAPVLVPSTGGHKYEYV